jgi:SAM-dependent methyltransferase
MPKPALYTDLSNYYDLMCSNIDYAEQCAGAYRIHQVFGGGGCEYLDLACGTGPHIEHFLAYGYAATGLDIHAPMLERAALRVPKARFSLQDMTQFTFAQSFDFITCFLYSAHYCYPSSAFLSLLQRVFNVLNPQGVFCFDVVDKNTIANDEGYKHSLLVDDQQFHFSSRWAYCGEGDKLDLHLCIERQMGGQTELWQDLHTMVALDIPTLQRLLEQVGFRVILLERDFTRLVPWGGHTGNIIVVCVKP